MFKKFCVCLTLLMFLSQNCLGITKLSPILPIFNDSDPLLVGFHKEQRDAQFRNFLSASVKIEIEKGSGSGTIIYYDPYKNLAYVASCGHLWPEGIVNEQDAKSRMIKCKIIAFYHNNKKLSSPKEYNATVVFYSFIRGQDTSLLTFTPDWEPDYFPIAPTSYEYFKSQKLHSMGCDQGTEVAHYEVEVKSLGYPMYHSSPSLITVKNSPRPGRSGGGLITDNGYYVGTCWGTEFKNGSGEGFFTPLNAIHTFWLQQKSYRFLLNRKKNEFVALKLPIVDRNTRQKKYAKNYILVPKNLN